MLNPGAEVCIFPFTFGHWYFKIISNEACVEEQEGQVELKPWVTQGYLRSRLL
jgi:hypothetical protein